MSDVVIKAEGLGKKYVIGHKTQRRGYVALRDVLAQGARNFWRKTMDLARGNPVIQGDNIEEVWALNQVNFEIKRGEAVGIIGRNGAGKSTLLKVLSRITEPSAGRVTIKGRVASLLEVGTGFHPELTGRENIFLNGAILGMTRSEIKKKFDEIVAFAEVEQYLDTPVKRYSSGMYVRLAFSVAAHLEPEILVVDEVLAVGDINFQSKCLGKMKTVSGEGRTVLFVSHNLLAIQRLCQSCLWIGKGKIVENGDVQSVTASYLRDAVEGRGGVSNIEWGDMLNAPGNEFVRLKLAKIFPEDKFENRIVNVETPLILELEYWNLIDSNRLNPNVQLLTEQGYIAFSSGPIPSDDPVWCGKPFPRGLFRSVCRIPGNLLNAGSYSVNLFFGKDSREVIFREDNLLLIEVQDSPVRRSSSYGTVPGAVRPHLKWKTEQIIEQESS